MILLIILVSIFVWWLIGCVVCASIDTEDMRLLEWAKSGPLPASAMLVAIMWPLVFYFWNKQRKELKEI